MAKNNRRVNLEKPLDVVLRELQQDMAKSMGSASYAQAQRELAFRAREFQLQKFKMKIRKDGFFR